MENRSARLYEKRNPATGIVRSFVRSSSSIVPVPSAQPRRTHPAVNLLACNSITSSSSGRARGWHAKTASASLGTFEPS